VYLRPGLHQNGDETSGKMFFKQPIEFRYLFISSTLSGDVLYLWCTIEAEMWAVPRRPAAETRIWWERRAVILRAASVDTPEMKKVSSRLFSRLLCTSPLWYGVLHGANVIGEASPIHKEGQPSSRHNNRPMMMMKIDLGE
jgi:hypothetical protein